VIGSLLKEYLDVPQKEGEQLNASEIRDKEIAMVEVNNAPMDDVLDSSKNPSHDLGNGEGASGESENDGQEIQSQLQKSCTSKEGSSSMLHFKNVVAIVDPPRGGLHPIVSVVSFCYACDCLCTKNFPSVKWQNLFILSVILSLPT
jgi:tRNA (uracil-5-)-methyltransferase